MFKRSKCLLSIVVLVTILAFTSSLNIGQEALGGTSYTVPAKTTVQDIAEEFFDTSDYWPAIMGSTNRKHIEDPSFIRIEDPKVPIEEGAKLWIPSKEWANMFMDIWTPSKPELLFGTRPKGQLVVASWWTAGGEAEGLKALFDIYKNRYPNVEIVNATIAGGAGFNFRAVIKPRLIAGDPPDSFQLHAGLEVEGYSPETYLKPLDDLYLTEGWNKVFPQDLLDLLRYKGHYWGVPANIHRANVLWYDQSIFKDADLNPPKTWDEFFSVAEKLKAKGIVPLVLTNAGGWEAPHAFETMLVSTCGAEKYKGLWNGDVSWTDSCVTRALEIFKKVLGYVNADYSALTWDGAAEYMIANKGAMNIMGDWINGLFMAKNYTDYGWTSVPGAQGIFDALSDTFSFPKQAKNKDNVTAWLAVVGSKEGQIAFNTKKGSIPARTDLTEEEKAQFNPYLRSAMEDFKKDKIVPSVIHGAAAIESWVTDFKDAITMFLVRKDVKATQDALVKAAKSALETMAG